MMLKEGCSKSLRGCVLAAGLLSVAVTGGCAKVAVKPKPASMASSPAPMPVQPPSVSDEAPARLTLSAIVNHDLQNGHYLEGEKALRRYLKEHPGDRSAQFFLRQLTEDPKQALGAASTPHVVQAGESYSTLAGKYLGDANLFLVLARYNGSTNPALIHAGATLQLPASQSVAASAPAPTEANTAAAVVTPAASAAPLAAGPMQRAQQLEGQSVALYRQGHREQALAMFDQALTLNPQLKSSDPEFAALSKAWVANSHQQAMVFYLDQHLDQAIALWNRILVVDPGYEPAVVYRTRAVELKQRLQQY